MPTITHVQTAGSTLYAKPTGSTADPYTADVVALVAAGPATYTLTVTGDSAWTIYLQAGAEPVQGDPIAATYTPDPIAADVAAIRDRTDAMPIQGERRQIREGENFPTEITIGPVSPE